MSTVDFDDYLDQLTDLEGKISKSLEDLAGMQGEEKRQFGRSIEDSLNSAKHFITALDLELYELPAEFQAEYEDKKNHHQQIVTDFEDTFKATMRGNTAQQGGPLTDADLANKALDLQKQQINSLDNSLIAINQMENIGNDSLDEINRQQNKMAEAMDDMNAMDNELDRGKKIMKQMLYRAAGDCCVRVLAVIVVLVLVILIVVEAVSPGAIKKTSDGWFENNTTSGTVQ